MPGSPATSHFEKRIDSPSSASEACCYSASPKRKIRKDQARMREMELDAAEGADILMVKPAITSLDLLARAHDRFDLPLAAYQVSGEAAMIEAAAEKGWVDRRRAILETLTSIVRAGSGIVI